jgi:hypothetical protein
MASQKDGGLVSRAVREALGTLVSTQVYGQLVTRSLRASGLEEIPEGGRVLADWIKGALNREIETAVGADAAELVAAQLASIVAHAAAQPEPASAPASSPKTAPDTKPASRRDAFGSEQPTGIVAAPKVERSDLARTARVKLSRDQLALLRETASGHTMRPEASNAPSEQTKEPTRVLTATTSRSALNALKTYLASTAEVVQVMDLVGLLDALEASTQAGPIVLLDCQRPTVHVTSIAAIGEDLPPGTAIVLWGGSDEMWNQIDRSRLTACRWVRCSQEATTDDVGSLCAMLIGAVRL